MEKATLGDCLDVARFRNLLKQDRRHDDNLTHRLNAIDAKDYMQCIGVAKWLGEMHAARRRAIRDCIALHERAGKHKGIVNEKENTLLNGEIVVEDIVEDRSWTLLHERCRVLGDDARKNFQKI